MRWLLGFAAALVLAGGAAFAQSQPVNPAAFIRAIGRGETVAIPAPSIIAIGKGEIVPLGGASTQMIVQETQQEVRIQLPADILFDFDKSVLRASARPALEQAAELVRQHPGASIRIEGHTDSKGKEPYNVKLSIKRGEAVRAFLADAAGLDPKKVQVEGFAARRPLVPNTKPDGSDDPDGRQRNRRVEIVLAK